MHAGAQPTTAFGPGTGSIWFSNVNCHGSETHLMNCEKTIPAISSCGHINDAGVRCGSM